MRIVLLAMCVAIGACARSERAGELAKASSAAVPPARDDVLVAQLRSPDEMVRYRAAARAFQELGSSDVSPEARQALFGIVENATERDGVRLWAARAVAKHEPERALKRFVELSSAGVSVDGDAWLVLGPLALPALGSRCSSADCPDAVFIPLTLIAGGSPSHEDSRAAIPLLLRESTRSEERKALVYRALGGFGSSLVPELSALQKHDDPVIRRAASDALAAVRNAP